MVWQRGHGACKADESRLPFTLAGGMSARGLALIAAARWSTRTVAWCAAGNYTGTAEIFSPSPLVGEGR